LPSEGGLPQRLEGDVDSLTVARRKPAGARCQDYGDQDQEARIEGSDCGPVFGRRHRTSSQRFLRKSSLVAPWDAKAPLRARSTRHRKGACRGRKWVAAKGSRVEAGRVYCEYRAGQMQAV